jgi:hypothetical protein
MTMRVVALAADRFPTFSVQGTLFIIGLGTALGVAPGIIYATLGQRLPGPPLAKGATFGTILYVLLGIYPLFVRLADSDLDLGPPWLGRGLFSMLFLAYGLVLETIEPAVRHAVLRARAGVIRVIGSILLTLWGVGGITMFISFAASALFEIQILRF